ncbi:MAG: sigma-54-dependent transcriptional regulator [Gammaproteobacteria bacterium]
MLDVLLVDDDTAFITAAAELIRAEGFNVAVAASLAEARAAVQPDFFHLVLVDLILPDGSGLELVVELSAVPATKVVLITGYASVDSVIEAVRMRVMDYLTKPLDIAHLRRLLMRVKLQQAHDDITLISADGSPANFGPLIGTSPKMRELYAVIEKVATTDVPVLICGESGTGKDLVGRAIHELSGRSDRQYLALNCGVLAPTLVGSELFGHERGSFTGASRQHKGYFERASGGTLLLDEVTEMAPDLQVHLLRVLETGTVIRLGGSREIKVDVRVIAATNRRPEEVVGTGKFRKDLFFRLSGFPITVPPLRERNGDIELLARHFLSLLNREYGTRKTLSAAASQRLQNHTWPGNVRELRNAIERAYVVSSAQEIGEKDIADLENMWSQAASEAPAFTVGSTLEDVERELIYAALRYFGGNKQRAAQSLGISLKTVYNRLNKYADGDALEEEPEGL